LPAVQVVVVVAVHIEKAAVVAELAGIDLLLLGNLQGVAQVRKLL
jgi:hypothetical protein